MALSHRGGTAMSRRKREIRYTDKTYYTVYGWMKNLSLDRAVRDIFAWIWSFARLGKWNQASTSEYAKYLHLSETAVRKYLRKLLAVGLVIRELYTSDYGPAYRYTVPSDVVEAINELVNSSNEWGIQSLPLHSVKTPEQSVPAIEDMGCTEFSSSAKRSLPQTSSAPLYKDSTTDIMRDNSNTVGVYNDASAHAVDDALTVSSDEPSYPINCPTICGEDDLMAEVCPDGEQTISKKLSTTPVGKKKKWRKKEKSADEVSPDEWEDRLVTKGVTQKTAAKFVNIRFNKKRPKWNEEAWKDVEIGIAKAATLGKTPEQFIFFMAHRGWYSCNESYIFNYLQRAQPEELQEMSAEEAVAAFSVNTSRRLEYNQLASVQAETRYERIKRRDAEGDDIIDKMFNQ